MITKTFVEEVNISRKKILQKIVYFVKKYNTNNDQNFTFNWTNSHAAYDGTYKSSKVEMVMIIQQRM